MVYNVYLQRYKTKGLKKDGKPFLIAKRNTRTLAERWGKYYSKATPGEMKHGVSYKVAKITQTGSINKSKAIRSSPRRSGLFSGGSSMGGFFR